VPQAGIAERVAKPSACARAGMSCNLQKPPLCAKGGVEGLYWLRMRVSQYDEKRKEMP
jgi:hypothetical protein